MKNCPNCNAQMEDDSLFCTECGRPFSQGCVCTNCGAKLNDEDLFCQNCGQKVNQDLVSDNEIAVKTKCPFCGSPTSPDDIFCQNCGKRLDEKEEKVNIPNPDSNQEHLFNEIVHKPLEQQSNLETAINYNIHGDNHAEYHQKSNNNMVLIGVIALLVILTSAVGGYFYYKNIYLPQKIDREAPRYYSMANVIVLRSSRSAGADFNKVASLPYGTELITYSIDSEWAQVKVNSQNEEKQEGYVASQYILNKADFFLMNSIFGNQDSKETILTTKCRIALLNYFKENQYIGKIDNQMRIDAGIATTPNSSNQWQVFCKPKDVKPNNVLYKRLYNSNSQFTDFAVIITNIVNSQRKLLYFYFDNDETPHLLAEQSAPLNGYIVNASYDYDYYSDSKKLNIEYSY